MGVADLLIDDLTKTIFDRVDEIDRVTTEKNKELTAAHSKVAITQNELELLHAERSKLMKAAHVLEGK